MKKTLLLLILILTLPKVSAQTSIFNDLLQKHVAKDGVVDYKNFNGIKLRKYLTYLEKTTPTSTWSENKQKAFWINAYNANTIYLILHAIQAKKINSIMQINSEGKSAWKIPFVKVGKKKYTLDYIEHEILRKKFFDPRIHVGVNCASGSCPKLANSAFTEENIDASLEKLMKEFVNDSTKNKLSEKNIQISSIFGWFKEDFTKNGSIIDFLNTYSEIKINPKAEISYLKYNWALNGK